jgi:hypothetical protein
MQHEEIVLEVNATINGDMDRCVDPLCCIGDSFGGVCDGFATALQQMNHAPKGVTE